MIWVRLWPGASVEDVARRVASVLGAETLPDAWHCSTDLASPGWVSVRARYRPAGELAAVVAALRDIDGREVRTISPREAA